MYILIKFSDQTTSLHNSGDLNIWLWKNAREAAEKDNFAEIKALEIVMEWVESSPAPGQYSKGPGFVIFKTDKEE